ncbi:hypothetical protein SAMN05216258_1361, partial [Albimonas pacifica]
YARRDSKGWADLQNDVHRKFLKGWLEHQGATFEGGEVQQVKEN